MEQIIPLNLPPAKLQLTRSDGVIFIQCLVRKKKLVLTPEEWVRQHIIAYLVQLKAYPISSFQLEFPVVINKRNLRIDILVLDNEANPFLLVECKAPHIALTENTTAQLLQYQHHVNAKYLSITNGLTHDILSLSDNKIQKEEDFPFYLK